MLCLGASSVAVRARGAEVNSARPRSVARKLGMA